MYGLVIEFKEGGLSESLLLSKGQFSQRIEIELYGLTNALCETLVSLGIPGLIQWILSDDKKPQTAEETLSRRSAMEAILRDAAASMVKRISNNYVADTKIVQIMQKELFSGDVGDQMIRPGATREENYLAKFRIITNFLGSVHKSCELPPWQFERQLEICENQIYSLYYPSHALPLDETQYPLTSYSSILWPLALKEAKLLRRYGVFGKICVVCNKVFSSSPNVAKNVKTCSEGCRKKWRDLRLLRQCGDEEGVRAYWREKQRTSRAGLTRRKKKGGEPDVEKTGER